MFLARKPPSLPVTHCRTATFTVSEGEKRVQPSIWSSDPHTKVRKGLGNRLSRKCTRTPECLRICPIIIKAPKFWDKSKQPTFFDVRIFNSLATSNCTSSSDACYRRHEHEKRRAYEQRILEVEHGTFTPLVLSTSGGWGPSATMAFKRLAGLISEKHCQPYSSTLNFIRCKISFSLIDSAIACLRGPRTAFHAPARELNLTDHPLDLIHAEVQLQD